MRWLFFVLSRNRLYIIALTLVQAANGGSWVLYALLMRNIVDAAVRQDSDGFWMGIASIQLLVMIQLALWAIIRWLNDLSEAAFENIIKSCLTYTYLRETVFASSS